MGNPVVHLGHFEDPEVHMMGVIENIGDAADSR